MNSVSRVFLSSWFLSVLGVGAVSAQSTFDFSLLVTANGTSGTVPNDQQITITSALNTQTTVTVRATYIGSTEATITQPAPQLFGSTEFTAAYVNATPPIIVTPGESFTFTVTYLPTSPNNASANVQIAYTEPGTGTTPVSNSIFLVFNGNSPAYTLDYILATDNNQILIASGGTIQFPPTQLNTQATAALQINNTGGGEGGITGIALVSGGPVFKLTGVPIATPALPFPLGVTPLTVDVLYTPTAVGTTDTGQIQITFVGGAIDTINLAGSGATSSYSYSYVSGTTSIPVSPNGTITLPSVTLATSGTTPATSSVILTVTNKGNANGTINSINWTGPFLVTGQLATPPTLKPGDTESFTITYTPTQVGPQTGSLEIGSDMFILSGKGLGPALTFSYVSSGTTITVPTGGAVDFIPIPVSQSEKVTFSIMNSGTSTATISNISTTSSSTPNPFAVSSPPLSLAPGQVSQFTITFTPAIVGTVIGTLFIDNTQVGLLGTGTAPPNLPSYTISGPSGNAPPASYSPVSLTLANSYPVDLTGVLTLTTSGNLGTDTAVQFSTGNRTVDFTIPANTTSANFAGQGSQIFVQTGTVAETIIVAPSFTTTAGVNVTPASPTTLQFTIASSAPVLESLQVINTTASGFTLVIVGYSTTRSLNSLTVTFNPATGYNVPTSQFTTDLSQVATVWFGSASSQTSFGGLFQVTVPFNLTGTVPAGQTLLQAIASVSATISNSIGTSSSVQANLP